MSACNLDWESSNQTYEELLHEIDQLLELAKIDAQPEGSIYSCIASENGS
jgi:hypothetical protein